MTELKILRAKVDKLSYPPSVIKINGEIPGLGFFPGADGMLEKSDKISDKKIMVLGQDQDNEQGFKRSLDRGYEDYSKTWQNMKALFGIAGISIVDCFFTNCIMGIRKNSKSNTGKSPAMKEPEFLRQCLEFLEFQIALLNPRAIVSLGAVPASLLCMISQNLNIRLGGEIKFSEIDSRQIAVSEAVKFENIPELQTMIILLTHPSYRQINAKRRKYGHHTGSDAEIAMLQEIKLN